MSDDPFRDELVQLFITEWNAIGLIVTDNYNCQHLLTPDHLATSFAHVMSHDYSFPQVHGWTDFYVKTTKIKAMLHIYDTQGKDAAMLFKLTYW
jgi:hypothetical protein